MMILLLPGCVYTGFDASISVGAVGVNVNDGDGFCDMAKMKNAIPSWFH